MIAAIDVPTAYEVPRMRMLPWRVTAPRPSGTESGDVGDVVAGGDAKTTASKEHSHDYGFDG